MNILLIDHGLPSSKFSGKTVRLINIYGRLARRHRIIFLRTTPVSKRESEELHLWCKETFYKTIQLQTQIKPGLLRKAAAFLLMRPWFDLRIKASGQLADIQNEIGHILASEKIDAVINFSIEAAPYCELIPSTPWIQDLGDSLVLWLQRQMRLATSPKQRLSLSLRHLREKGFEENMIKKSSATIFVADDDASFYTQLKHRIHVIPNGVDTEYFNRDRVPAHAPGFRYVVFSGHMNFKPNIDAVSFFAEQIFPILRNSDPNIHFIIVGADPTDEIKKLTAFDGIEVTGKVPDLRPYLAGASAFVCPMRLGSGIKNKILEAMAMQLPIIASEMALRGVAGYPAHLIRLADNPAAFAKQVQTELSHPLSDNDRGCLRHFVEQHYSWQKAIQAYETLFNSLGAR